MLKILQRLHKTSKTWKLSLSSNLGHSEVIFFQKHCKFCFEKRAAHIAISTEVPVAFILLNVSNLKKNH